MNEVLLFFSAVLSGAFVLTAWKLGKERLYSAIIVFLILIAAVGGKIVEFFGFATNTGNIFYASVFLATYFLIERYGTREGIRSIWIGVVAVAFFSVLARITSTLIGSGATAELDTAISVAFSPLLRLTFASLLAYAISQSLNVYVYIYLKERWEGARLWLRANVTNAIAQVVDSAVFFLVAFWGVVPFTSVWEVIVTGFILKVIFMMLASPLLYLNRVEEEDGEELAVIAIR
jgi:uncharacterized integral membrane protein (TIGR00697 family)